MIDIVAQMGPVLLGSRFKRLAERLQAGAASIISEAGIPLQPSHIPVMAALDGGPMTIGRLSEETGTRQPGVTRSVGQLVKLGMVVQVAGHDQRERLASLTPAGQAAMARTRQQVWPRIGQAVEGLLAGIAPAPLLDQIAALEAGLASRSLAERVADLPPPRFTIHEFSDELAPLFLSINAEWISAMFTLEATDREVLENPRAAIIAPGGTILFIEAEGLGIIGTCALQQTSPGRFELTKMGVSSAARGLKAGEFLLDVMIERARQMGAQQLYLLTNQKCAAAIHLYEKAGFRHDAAIMAQYGARYQRCNVAMDYPL
ncbi:helix-turn-helix domain-containing GNAT family N-acetyltransferase [Novosphingobium sp.]|uniref:bifunctional helix-turn-helix transcriptional regulator/GNAT family N-acetyltransferase n=1 Tax=Novosphingobium sp. TaxID=1874826 RepID=UPI00286B9C3D|nr:helix-turn-helix domain-containing GNAT family N-acetyltransferase [Novosphingobium sp.]